MMGGDDAIVLEGAAKRFGTHTALHPTDLAIAHGQAVLLVGANGAGKSTLLRLVAGLCRPSAGKVKVNGCDPQRIPEARAEVGLLSHQTLLYDELTARENLRFFAQLYGLDNPEERLAAALAAVGLNERLDQRVGSFSRGMKQRLAIARAILHRPSILLLDEPFTGLDASASTALHRLLCRFRQEGRTCILVTHRPDEAEDLVDRLLVIERGQWRLDQVLSENSNQLRTLCAPYLDANP
ncbi:MAG: heme ABC exporter ATP-binding protein CcmA [Gemmatimonadetes bacterium]|nr:heme ABC exporter ATP-binding protein CcmA [Gemmatimonadota bacterium]MXY82462.1 heme ABC exporter ATP-binding protein CcmA [Gemmatimonadota bacterium]MYB68752.1 heme ABC exporter ATP-binding protein CcmA [Gemmatimonadota bacterium]